MTYKNIEYPLRLCVELMHYCAVSNDLTKNMTPVEIKNQLKVFFTEDQINRSTDLLKEPEKQGDDGWCEFCGSNQNYPCFNCGNMAGKSPKGIDTPIENIKHDGTPITLRDFLFNQKVWSNLEFDVKINNSLDANK